MTGFSKFTFDRQFEASAVQDIELEPPMAEPVPEEDQFIAADVDAARAEGYAEGRRDALEEANNAVEELTSAALQRIADGISGLNQQYAEQSDQTMRDGVDLCAAIARKFADSRQASDADQMVGAVLSDILPRLVDEPRVVVRVPEPLLDPLQQRIETITAKCGFTGAAILLSDPELSNADCRIEWADGGAESRSSDLWRDIEDAISRHMGPGEANPEIIQEHSTVETGDIDTPIMEEPSNG